MYTHPLIHPSLIIQGFLKIDQLTSHLDNIPLTSSFWKCVVLHVCWTSLPHWSSVPCIYFPCWGFLSRLSCRCPHAGRRCDRHGRGQITESTPSTHRYLQCQLGSRWWWQNRGWACFPRQTGLWKRHQTGKNHLSMYRSLYEMCVVFLLKLKWSFSIWCGVHISASVIFRSSVTFLQQSGPPRVFSFPSHTHHLLRQWTLECDFSLSSLSHESQSVIGMYLVPKVCLEWFRHASGMWDS